MLSGTRANIALKLFGDDLDKLRALAEQVKKVAEGTPGAVDVAIEQQVDIPELEIRTDRDAVARYGLTTGEVAEAVERAFAGETVGTVLEGQRTVELVVRLDDASRADLEAHRVHAHRHAGGAAHPAEDAGDARRARRAPTPSAARTCSARWWCRPTWRGGTCPRWWRT